MAPETPAGSPGGPSGHRRVDARGGRTQAQALERLATVASQADTDRIEAAIPPQVEALQRAGVGVIVLKGPVTRARLYGPDERRPVADIDLLVDPSGFARAARVLTAAGFHRVDRHGHSDTFVSDRPDTPEIDLHLTLPYVTVPPRRAFRVFGAHTELLTVAGTPVPVLDVPAHVVHLAIHAAVNRFATGGRTFEEWRRGHDLLGDDDRVAAWDVAAHLGVLPVWELAVQALDADTPAERAARAAELPTWEVEARLASARRFLASGTPVRVKWRDLERLVALQLSDDTLNVWRAKSGRAPLASGSWQIRAAKPLRLVVVGSRGLGRVGRALAAPRPSRTLGGSARSTRRTSQRSGVVRGRGGLGSDMVP